ncbi:MAG: cobaltochelatase subunit CobS [Rickettsiales bacterium]|nr:cobaltochelatase subunit CobS [Rickettsiales bacterium]OUT45316.1 MAG: cobaltochelatase subunit CobS [Pelagibacteraceae bacterium TMED13]
MQVDSKEIKDFSPDINIDVSSIFGMKKKMKVQGFKEKSALVPTIDENYIFDEETTTSILVGFKFNKKVLIQGLHGTGKSSHIEQVAARLNWPCLRINLDGHISRFDLLGKDSIVLKDNKQVTTFKEGLLPWAIQNPVALVLDEYDAGRPDVMFVIQRILEVEGKLTLLDQNKVITPHPFFRIFGTCNTLGLGDNTGLYSGTQNLNQGQLDRWNIFSTLNFIEPDIEKKIIEGKLGKDKSKISDKLTSMIRLANLIRQAFSSSDLSVTMSPRTCILWAENFIIFGNLEKAFKLTFLNKCEMNDKKIIIELYQRCFGKEIE